MRATHNPRLIIGWQVFAFPELLHSYRGPYPAGERVTLKKSGDPLGHFQNYWGKSDFKKIAGNFFWHFQKCCN